MTQDMERPLLRVEGLSKHFTAGGRLLASGRKTLKAVDGVSFEIRKGETFGLVGESGCGKSTLARTAARMYPVTQGRVFYDGDDITNLSHRELKPYRKKMQFIFQDPYSALNPYFTVRDILLEPMKLHLDLPGKEMLAKAEELLEHVGLNRQDMGKYPHEFSGGQRQRLGIARSLSVNPELILCDEPISALDVSIQAQIVNILTDLQAEIGLTYLFVAHDLAMVRHISDHIGVMYLGRFVETAANNELHKNPIHPYTQALLASIPRPDPKLERQANAQMLKGEVPSPINMPSGCGFRTRCPFATSRCAEETPELKEAAPGHKVACHL